MSKKQYKKVDQIEHIMLRPDMYAGSIRNRVSDEYVADSEYNITKQTINSSPALLRIFIEVLSNALDNVERSKKAGIPCTSIQVTINKETGETSIWNDGDIVPIELNIEHNCYNHSLIFGQLLTGSNYDDEEDRIVAGRNGLGVKLCNVFSKQFSVEGCDPTNKKILTQSWTNNMRNTDGPVIQTTKLNKGYTCIKWIPDFTQFGIEGYTDDIVKLYTKYVVDASMISKIKVSLNDKLIPINTLTKYATLYKTPSDEKLSIKTDTCEVLLTTSTEFEAVSFVNGVFTKLGGQHVDAWAEAIFRPIVDKFNGKDKKSKSKAPKINISDVKQFFRLFVSATVIRPEFDGQDKNKLESPVVEAAVKATHVNAIMKWSVVESIEDIIRSKEMLVLKKSEKGRKMVKIDGFDQANNAGGKHSNECTLIVCEGLSAKTYAVAGIEQGVYGKSGRDWYGILPLTGKILNVRNAAPTAIAGNKVVTNLVQALGVRHGVDYNIDENYNSLNYGRIMIMTDADCDGIHIEGLLMNFFHSLFPTLLERTTPYIVSMKTPIARVFKTGQSDLLFYDERRFNEWLGNQTGKVNVKYYKGLGTTKTEDVPDTFGLKMVEYVQDAQMSANMNKVFHKDHADSRKEWLGTYSPTGNSFSLDDQPKMTSMNVSSFIDGEMIKFSHADCARSIPNGIDGLKESQRKILYAVRKRKLKYSGSSLKVAQLSGYTAEHSNYHHGEQNLQETIIGMANEFPGTNNIPLLYRDGQFGSRLDGGADAASPRYIYTKMDMLTEYIFRSEDDPVLKSVNDDGDLVQPEFYVPIIPMLLINGCVGIGTGWSCNIPCYNPADLIDVIRKWLEQGTFVASEIDIRPWYRGLKGPLVQSGENKYISYGIIEKSKKDSVIVSELPVGMWTNKFKEFCEDLVQNKQLKSMKNYSTPKQVNFVLNQTDNGISCNLTNLKLHSYVYTSNMVVFDEKEQLRKYATVGQIIEDFCKVRFSFYTKRKNHQLSTLDIQVKHLENKMKFVKGVIDGTVQIMNSKESSIVDVLTNVLKLDKEDGSYDYLMRMQVRTFTNEKVVEMDQEIKTVRESIRKLKSTSEKEMWLRDLDEFEKQYEKFLKTVN